MKDERYKIYYEVSLLHFGDEALYCGRFALRQALDTAVVFEASSLFVLIDEGVHRRWGEALEKELSALSCPVHVRVIAGTEAAKSISEAETCWREMVRAGCDRSSVVLGIGGGVTCDLAGFVAACFMRGVSLVLVPTTLLAMVDAAIGGKTAINLPEGKNLVGAFHPAQAVVVDPQYLETLPTSDRIAGLAEIIKIAVIADPNLFTQLEAGASHWKTCEPDQLLPIIEQSIRLKQSIAQKDKTERNGLRRLLNFGHTFGHAIEAATGFQTYRHGEAVAIGMSCAGILAERLERAPRAVRKRVDALSTACGLPIALGDLDPGDLVEWMKRDKKNCQAEITCIIAEEIGKVDAVPGVDPSTLVAVLEEKRNIG